MGSYLKIKLSINYSSIKDSSNTELNSIQSSWQITYDNITTNPQTFSDSSFEKTQAASTSSITFSITTTDALGKSVSKKITLPSVNYLMHFRTNSIGIGSAASAIEKTLTIGWKTKFNDSVELALNSPLPLSSGGTESNNRLGAFNKIVAEGGTITGDLITSGTLNVQGILDMQGTFSIKNNNIFPQMSFIPKITTVPLGKIYVYGGVNSTDTVLNNSRFAFRQYSYTSNSTTIDSETYDTFLLPKTEANIKSGTKTNYDIFTTKNYCYYPSNTITLTSGWGYVSAEGKNVEVWFPVAKYLDKVSSATVTSMKGNIRAGKTYWVAGKHISGGYDFTSLVTSVSLIPEQKLISVILASSAATKTDLGGDTINLNNFTTQFNGTLQISFT